MAGNSVRMLYARVDMYDLFHCARQLEVFRLIRLKDLMKELRRGNTIAAIVLSPRIL
jgi:hypothetical protein